jgi:hypothetical protein
VLTLASLINTIALILSLLMRTTWFLMNIAIWFLVFAPAQALKAFAKRMGAENYIKVGEYILLFILRVCAVFQK